MNQIHYWITLTYIMLTPKQSQDLFAVLEARFHANMTRHMSTEWDKVQAKIESRPALLQPLVEMERTGGEPDVVQLGKGENGYVFCDCSTESPSGRRSLCYDREALDSRKEHKPRGSALDMARQMGVSLLTEEQYHRLQELGHFDTKTSSWILTPPGVRTLGGALYCDRRYDRVFVYHNGAESYYAARGFRGVVKI